MKLLIVDDSTLIRNRITRILQGSRFKTIHVAGTAKNGAEAIKFFQQHMPELVTMDITMPRMDGIECTEKIISLRPDCNILIISALSDKATALKALKKGARGFLYKPFTDEELLTAFLELISP